MRSITVLYWNGCEPTSITFRTTEDISKEDILKVVFNSDMEIIEIKEDLN